MADRTKVLLNMIPHAVGDAAAHERDLDLVRGIRRPADIEQAAVSKLYFGRTLRKSPVAT
jgi:hypothetical protein